VVVRKKSYSKYIMLYFFLLSLQYYLLQPLLHSSLYVDLSAGYTSFEIALD